MAGVAAGFIIAHFEEKDQLLCVGDCTILEGHTGSVYACAFSPDGCTIASVSDDNTLRVWDLDPTSWQIEACQRAGKNMYPAEWAIYFADEAYRKTCLDYPDG